MVNPTRVIIHLGALACLLCAAARDVRCAAPQVTDAAVLTDATREDDFPAIGTDAQGNLWVAWVSFDDTADQILIRRRHGDTWQPATPLSQEPGDYHAPRLGLDEAGGMWAVWPANRDGQWELVARRLDGQQWSPETVLTTNRLNDFNPSLARDASGRLWLAWQAVDGDNYEIMCGRLSPRGLIAVSNVSHHPANDWKPALAPSPQGGVWIAWDSYRYGGYDIFLSRLNDGVQGSVVRVTSSPDYEAHAGLACDARDRCWVIWDNGGPHWAKTRGRAIHRYRRLSMACVAGGEVRFLSSPVNAALGKELRGFNELPRLMLDRDGRLWLLFRHMTDLNLAARLAARKAKSGRIVQARGIWNFYATCATADGWTKPVLLPDSNGRNDQRIDVALAPDGGLWVAYADDGRRPQRAEEPVNHNIHVARLTTTAPAAWPAIGAAANPAPAAIAARPPIPRTRLQADSNSYELLFGDTHRHTDISRCAMNSDGSLADTYRYAIDVARLDFLAISDHDQDILRHRYGRPKHKLMSYAWWRSQKYCDLYTIGDRFIPLYGYEHGGSYQQRGGHKNVIYARRGNPCLEDDSPKALFTRLEKLDAIAIPHQLADGNSRCDWAKWDPRFERVAEIFQARGSYEYYDTLRPARRRYKGFFLWDAYAMDVRIGIIASSDHGLVHGAYAGVFARERTRSAILEALRARRTYGSTENIVLTMTADGHPMGSEYRTNSKPELQVSVQALRPLKEVAIVRNGRFIHVRKPESPRDQFAFVDEDWDGAPAYYYVRAVQEDNNIAWGSPVWLSGE